MANDNTGGLRPRWTIEKEDQLVELWRQHECLYNVSSKSYHNKAEKEKAWEQMAAALDVPVLDVKTRTTSLRTQYSKVLKPNRSGGGDGVVTSRQRWLLTSLDFLKKHVIQRSVDATLDLSVKDEMTELNIDDITSETDDLSEISDEPAGNLSSTISESNVDCLTPADSPAKKPKKNQTVDPLEQRKLELLRNISETIRRPAADSNDTFGKLVAMELRLIKSPVMKTKLKRKIMNMIYEAQECDLTNHTPCFCSL
ncbi:uncharacterized protein KZ484_026107 isoform 1-T1 [Pholidichthys leucotaenia]